MFTLTTRDTRH